MPLSPFRTPSSHLLRQADKEGLCGRWLKQYSTISNGVPKEKGQPVHVKRQAIHPLFCLFPALPPITAPLASSRFSLSERSLTQNWFLPSKGLAGPGIDWVWVGLGRGVPGTCCQCRSFIPGLQEMLRIGMCCLNFSILTFTFSANRLGAGTSARVLVNLYIVLHMFPISSAISSAFSKKRGPEIENMGWGKDQNTKRMLVMCTFNFLKLEWCLWYRCWNRHRLWSWVWIWKFPLADETLGVFSWTFLSLNSITYDTGVIMDTLAGDHDH